MQDAINVFEKYYSITPEKLGMADYYDRNLDPQAVIATALEGEERRKTAGTDPQPWAWFVAFRALPLSFERWRW